MEWQQRSKWARMTLVFIFEAVSPEMMYQLRRGLLLSRILIWNWLSELIEEIGCCSAPGTLYVHIMYIWGVHSCCPDFAWFGGNVVLLKYCFSAPCFLDCAFVGVIWLATCQHPNWYDFWELFLFYFHAYFKINVYLRSIKERRVILSGSLDKIMQAFVSV